VKGTVLAVETGPVVRRAALQRDGVLEAVEVDRLTDHQPRVGAIYRCRITGRITGIGAATADMGGGITGFFPDAADLSPGQSLLAEVRREADGEKAVRLSPAIQLRSAHLVFTPARPGINISRKIIDENERARLHAALAPFAAQGGFVVRTDARNASEDTMREQAGHLVRQYHRLAEDSSLGQRAPAPDAVARIVAGVGHIDTVMADEASAETLPATLTPRIDPSPFETLDLDDVLDALVSPRHDLAEGWISIDSTPALVAIDVNTGSATGGNATLRVNLDAARAIPRLLSLKKLGGLIVVDFAGAPKGDDRARIAAVFQQSVSRYLEGSKVLGWGPAGLLETACRRPGRSLAMLLLENPR